MASSQTTQQKQPPPTSTVIANVAGALSASLSPLLSYASIQPLLKGFGITATELIKRKALRAALQQVERFPQPQLAGVGTAQRNMVVTNTVRRAAYVVAATRRIADEMTSAEAHGESEEQGLSEAVSRENVYFLQHVNADAERILAATNLDAISAQYGDVVGWYAQDDDRITPECREANGKNFRVSDPPSIGYPGATHVSCRCYPGPPHANAELLPSSGAPLAANNSSEFDVVEFTQQLADYYQVRVQFAKPHEKVSKKSVNYRRAASGAEHRCGTCVMYRASRCDLVEGYIDPKDVCDKWEAKPDTVDLVFVPNPGDGPNTVRHVRSQRGVAFFHAPIGTPITEAEYQALLAARRAAREKHPQGHPERLEAERAVRQARKTRGSGTTSSSGDPVADEVSEVQQSAQRALDAVRLKAEVTGKNIPKPQDTESEIAQLRARLAQLKQSRAGRETGRNANTASRVDDKRIAQGQTKSAFERPDGTAMSKSEIGDTYEQLFATHGAPILEKVFGKPYEMISHAHGGARNTPLDFRLGHKYGGELKTMSATSESAQRGKMKTAIKKEEIDRKTAALEREGLQPLLVVQAVDQAAGKVDIYTHDAFASKFVKTMRHVGSYNYTHADFHDANTKAGYGRLFPKSDASTGPPSREPDTMAARLTSDEEYQRLLDIRREMQAKYPVGHPERVKAERAVRQARKKIHGGGGSPSPKPATPAPRPTSKPGRPAPVPKPLGVSGKLGTKNLSGVAEHQYTWSAISSIQQLAEANAESVISKQLDHHAQFVPGLLVNDNPVNFIITKRPSNKNHDTALGTATGTQAFSRIALHPKIFDHVLTDNAGRKVRAYPVLDRTPDEILSEGQLGGWWVPTDKKWTLADNVISHEIGHQVHNIAFSDHQDTLPRSKTFWEGLANELGISPPAPTIETTGYTMSGGKLIPGQKYTYPYATIQQWIKNNRDEIAKRISQYATGGETGDETKPREMLAELWTEHTLSSNPRGPAKFYGDYVRRRLSDQFEARKAEAALEQAAMRDYPKELFDFNPATQGIGTTTHLASINVDVTRKGTDKWEITLLNDSGGFQGAYGRGTYEEVVSLLQDTWVRRYKRKNAPKT